MKKIKFFFRKIVTKTFAWIEIETSFSLGKSFHLNFFPLYKTFQPSRRQILLVGLFVLPLIRIIIFLESCFHLFCLFPSFNRRVLANTMNMILILFSTTITYEFCSKLMPLHKLKEYCKSKSLRRFNDLRLSCG